MANANLSLPELLRMRLRASVGGCMPWEEVMRMALYEPSLGYYRRGVRRIGRQGDFFTSVSVGPLFGKLLAEFAHQTWAGMGKPGTFTIIEQGAHDGTLARDVLAGCRDTSAELFEAVRYVVIEPDELLREAQRETLEFTLASKLHHDAALCTGPAVFLCNELLDAFPVHRVRWNGAAWQELWVCEDESAPSGFGFVEGPLSKPSLLEEVARHGPELPPGWTTDICAEVAPWLDEVAHMPFAGAVLILDYGFTEEAHFAPERFEGTLRRYWRHQMDDKVLLDLGEADLTAHVDFSRVTDLALARGFTVGEFTEQGRFLTRLFVDAYNRHGVAPDPATQRQFHTLTHPGQMGRSFQALVLNTRSADTRL
jgi:SAM-dependent MidA family methyltransferase